MPAKMRRALVSVSNKEGLVDFVRSLALHHIDILSTGGTAELLRKNNVKVTDVSQYTGFPELLDGRLKTLHPRVFGGILGRRDSEAHREQMRQHDLLPIDMVVVNLYPFRETVAKPGVTLQDAVENIDIGGPSLLRAAAKNHEHVAVVTDPADYSVISRELARHEGRLPEDLLRRLAWKAFKHTAEYDELIHNYFGKKFGLAPETLNVEFIKVRDLRYGENPHQTAALYRDETVHGPSLATAAVVSEGKELSYNNLLDLEAALGVLRECAEEPCAVIIKHNTPCGAGLGADLAAAFGKAYESDPMSAYGGIVGLNRRVEANVAEAIAQDGRFFEAMVAPGFTEQAVEILTQRQKWGKKLRLVEVGEIPLFDRAQQETELRKIHGGALAQDRDVQLFAGDLQSVAGSDPDDRQYADLVFAWKLAKHARSNAIAIVKDGMLVGLGAGQVSRVDAVRIALSKAGERAHGAALASDAFFPFRDSIDEIARHGVAAVMQPGGSMRDEDVIAAAREAGITMLLTGQRHFKH